jgi:peptide/nickel transport system permease protein
MVIAAVFAEFIAPYDPILQDVPYRLRPPDESFWFGTDIYGRDVFSRIVYGAHGMVSDARREPESHGR